MHNSRHYKSLTFVSLEINKTYHFWRGGANFNTGFYYKSDILGGWGKWEPNLCYPPTVFNRNP